MNIDPLSEKYSYQSHYNFSENRVVDSRELEGLEAVHSTKLDSNGNTVHVLEKNIIVLTRQTSESYSGKKNERIVSGNNEKIANIKSELNTFYAGSKNSSGESVEFKFNVVGMSVENTDMDNGRESTQLAIENGIQSSTVHHEGGAPLVAPAAIISTAYPNGTQGITNGIIVKTNNNDTEGKNAHEVGHTMKLEDDYEGSGVMANPPNHINSKEVNEIINNSYEK